MTSKMSDAEIWNAYLMAFNGLEPGKPAQLLNWSKKNSHVTTLKFGDAKRICKDFKGKGVSLNMNSVNQLMSKTSNEENENAPPTSNPVMTTTSSNVSTTSSNYRNSPQLGSMQQPTSVKWISTEIPKGKGGEISQTQSTHKRRRSSVEPISAPLEEVQSVLAGAFSKPKPTSQPITSVPRVPSNPPPKPPSPPPETETPEEEEEEAPIESTKEEPEENQSTGGGSDLFSQINRGNIGAKGFGLRKVKDSEKTKNRDPSEKSGLVETKEESQNKPTRPQQYKAPQIQKEESFKQQGNKYIAENYNTGVIKFEDAKLSNECWILSCNSSGYLVPNKVKGVMIDGCKKVEIEINSVISSVEIVNCDSIKLFIKGIVPSIIIDKTSSPTLVLFKEALEKVPKIISSLTTDMNIEIPSPNSEDWETIAIPYQFETTIDPETREMQTVPYSHV